MLASADKGTGNILYYAHGQSRLPPRAPSRSTVAEPGQPRQRGVQPGHMGRLVEIATADICHQTNPRPCTAADFERFFSTAM